MPKKPPRPITPYTDSLNIEPKNEGGSSTPLGRTKPSQQKKQFLIYLPIKEQPRTIAKQRTQKRPLLRIKASSETTYGALLKVIGKCLGSLQPREEPCAESKKPQIITEKEISLRIGTMPINIDGKTPLKTSPLWGARRKIVATYLERFEIRITDKHITLPTNTPKL